MVDAQMTNHTGLGWLDEFVAPVASNITGCEELYLPDLHGAHEWLAPLAAGLKLDCKSAEADLAVGLARRRLGTLDFEGSKLGDAGVGVLAPAVSSCASLTHLFLPASRVGDAGARALAGALLVPSPHAGLRVLDLSSNRVGDDGVAGLQALVRLPAPEITPVPLVELRLSENRIGPHGMHLLGDALRGNVLLHTLMLSDNPVGDEGGRALALALVARSPSWPSALRRVYLAGTNLTDAGALELLHALEQPHAPPLEVLVVEGNPGLSMATQRALEAALATARSRAQQGGTGIALPTSSRSASGIFLAA